MATGELVSKDPLVKSWGSRVDGVLVMVVTLISVVVLVDVGLGLSGFGILPSMYPSSPFEPSN
jgi:hypothetical protein